MGLSFWKETIHLTSDLLHLTS